MYDVVSLFCTAETTTSQRRMPLIRLLALHPAIADVYKALRDAPEPKLFEPLKQIRYLDPAMTEKNAMEAAVAAAESRQIREVRMCATLGLCVFADDEGPGVRSGERAACVGGRSRAS